MSRQGSRDTAPARSNSRSSARPPSPARQQRQHQYEALADVLSSSYAQPQPQPQHAIHHQQPHQSHSHIASHGLSQSITARNAPLVGIPSGRVQATDYQPPTAPPSSSSYTPHSPSLSYTNPTSPSLSPVYDRHPEGSMASLSSLGSDEGLSHDGREADDTHDASASMFSEAATMFDPNLYLHAQEAWTNWQHQHTHHRNVLAAEDDLEQTFSGHDVSESGFSRVEQMSERASLLSSSLAQRRKYGTLPQPGESTLSSSAARMQQSQSYTAPSTSALHHAGLSAIQEQTRPEHATMRDAMKTADIGGKPGSNLGLLLIAFSQLCYSFMNLFVTLLDERDGEAAPDKGPDNPPITAFEIVFVECFIIWVGATAAMLVFRTPHVFLGPPGVRMLLVVRGVFGFLSTLLLYISLAALSLSDATAITFLGPLATGLAASVFLGEPFSTREKLAGIGSLVGVMMIARPSAIFGDQAPRGPDVPSSGGDSPIEEDPLHGIPDGPPSARAFGVVIAILAVMCMSGAWISLRKIGRSASTYHSIAYFSLTSWTLSLAAMLATGQPFVWPSDWLSAFFLFSVGLFSLLAQVFQTIGLQRETAGRAAMMSYLQIIFATFFQVVLLGTPLELLSVAGSVLVLANGAWVAAAKDPEDAVGGH